MDSHPFTLPCFALSSGRHLRWLLVASVLLNLGACGARDSSGGSAGDFPDQGGGIDNGSCSVTDLNYWVDDNMHDYYLFSDQVAQLPVADYASPELLIQDLRVGPYDRYSYVGDEAQNTAYFEEGKQFGFGWVLERDADGRYLFAMVLPGSPLGNAGAQRGEELLAIDGIPMADFAALSQQEREQHLGSGTRVVSPLFTIGNGSDARELSVEKATYAVQSVVDTSVIAHNNLKIGYLHFYTFIEPSSAELREAFETLAAADVDELVLDLRYNSGGRISVAAELAGYIGGTITADKIFATFAFNRKYDAQNQSLAFASQGTALNLPRVFVLSTDRTCSASEMVINGLRPFVDVITIGSSSCGKPYGTSGRTRCGKVMHALEVEFQNANGVGGYFNGIGTDCAASDDPVQPLGTAGENLLKAALDYVDTGSCQQLAYRSGTTRQLPDLLNPYRDPFAGL